MDFDVNHDLEIFAPFFAKRPEVTRDGLQNDLQKYYLPYVKKLSDLKKNNNTPQGLIIGVSAIQGAGKTTQGEVLEILLNHFGFSTISRSIDDHYITHRELCELRTKDPRYIRRGVTHDIPLAIRDLKNLAQIQDNNPILVSGYDKGAQNGDGDRFRFVNPTEGLLLNTKIVDEELIVNKTPQNVLALQLSTVVYKDKPVTLPNNMGSDIPILDDFLPEELISFLQQNKDHEISITAKGKIITLTSNQKTISAENAFPNSWKLVDKKIDFIFYDGWMLGALTVGDESVFSSGLPALETESAQQFAKDINQKLHEYEPLWNMFNFMNVLYVPNYQLSLEWRDQAEDALRVKGKGMTHDQIREFVYYFWRSVHPGIHIKNLARDNKHTQQVVIISDNHSVTELLTPEEVALKY